MSPLLGKVNMTAVQSRSHTFFFCENDQSDTMRSNIYGVEDEELHNFHLANVIPFGGPIFNSQLYYR